MLTRLLKTLEFRGLSHKALLLKLISFSAGHKLGALSSGLVREVVATHGGMCKGNSGLHGHAPHLDMIVPVGHVTED